jgi:thiamine kinase-like enzyme
MSDITERLRRWANVLDNPRSPALDEDILEAADEIERLEAEHDDYVVRANANVCELNREIERLRAALSQIEQNAGTSGPDPAWKLSMVERVARAALDRGTNSRPPL